MSAEKERTPLEEAVARLLKQQADEAEQAAAEEAKLAAPSPAPPRRVQLVLELDYDTRGALVASRGRCNGRTVVEWKGAGDQDVGMLAVETLRCAGLRALLGAP